MSLPAEPDEFVLADIVRTAHVLAFVVIANGRHTDLFVWGQQRLVLVADGMLERGAASLDLVGEISETRSLHPRETTRRLADNVLAVTGPVLADDATLLVLEWHGRHGRAGRDRESTAGADSTAAD